MQFLFIGTERVDWEEILVGHARRRIYIAIDGNAIMPYFSCKIL
jgi:hypothetical protein